MKNKIVHKTQLESYLKELRSQKKIIVFTNGSFDILHAGHVQYLEKAKELGDVLIVGINSDASIRKYKSKDRPINQLNDRMRVLSALECIDLVIPFEEITPINLINIIRPDIHVKGGDYTEESLPETPIVKKYGGKIKLIPYVDGRSTTQVIKKIIKTYVNTALERCTKTPMYKA